MRVGKHGGRARLVEARHVARGAGRSGGAERVEPQAFDGHAALDAHVPRDLHGAVAARARHIEQAISVQDKILHATKPFIRAESLLYMP